MAVYTKLNFKQIDNFLSQNYNIGKLKDYKEIIAGIDNSNYIIETEQDKFIFTIFESRIKKEDLPFFMNLKNHLSSNDISCPKPIFNNDNKIISLVNDKSASVVSFLQGATLMPQEDGLYDNITNQHCQEIGQITAKMHQKASNFTQKRVNDLDFTHLKELFNQISNQIEDYRSGLKKEISQYINFIDQKWDLNLPSGPCHLDLFPDNVFFDKSGNLSAIIDFYFAANDIFTYDLAININAWCFDGKNQFCQEKYDILINSYQKTRKLSQKEQDFLPIALICASLRFLLTRFYDYFNTPEGSLVNVKNPDEYLDKIRFFINFKN
ncbi:homoserine kinase [Rickettsiales bacterium]|nr:homoserine kinase [Rickettsiales bacterium]